MLRLILNRFGQTALVVMIVSVIVFGLIRMTPGDPVDIFLGEQSVTAEQREGYRRDLGLDRPLVVQYFDFAWNALSGDLGRSILQKTSVATLTWNAFLATFELTVAGLVVGVLIGVPTALVAAMNHGRLADRLSSSIALFGISVPTFWLGIMMILLLSLGLGLFPTGGRIDAGLAPTRITGLMTVDALITGNIPALLSALRYLALPAISIGVALSAAIMQVLRGSLIAVKEEEFIYALRSRGLGRGAIYRHMLRNAAPPTVIIMGVKLGGLLGGAIVTESVFSWPGLGLLVVEAIRARDYPLVQGAVLFMAVVFVLVSLLTDIIHLIMDPRIRQGGEAK